MKKCHLLVSRGAWAVAAAAGAFLAPAGSAQPQSPQTYPPSSYPAQPNPAASYPGQSSPGQAYPTRQYPQSYPAQPYPGQSYPTQPSTAQSYPGQPYPGQPPAAPQYPASSYPASPAHSGPTSYPGQQSTSFRPQEASATRASAFLGTDVLTSDERRLGDVTDFVFDLGAPQRLAYVLVSRASPFGGDAEVRALPADAVTIRGDTARVALPRDQVLALPAVSGDPIAYLSDPQNLARLEQAFRMGNRGAGNAGSATGQRVQFTALNGREVHASQGERLGVARDAWINVRQDRSPYLEIQPGNEAMGAAQERVAIPLNRLQPNAAQDNRLTFNLSADEIRRAPVVSAAEGLGSLTMGGGDGRVVRITMPAQAGSPTGFEAAEATATPEAREAARKIRLAFDRNGEFRQAPVQVFAVETKVRLNGTVTTDQLRDRLVELAEQTAGSVEVDNQLQVPAER